VLILHGSDLQIGKPFRPACAEAFLSAARELRPDLVVVSGDLTQRAKAREYQAARAFLDRLADLPLVVTPGNHDVPLYRFWERLAAPYRNWRRYVSPELDSVTRLPGATVVALNTSAPWRTIISGRLRASQIDFARRAFENLAEGDARIIVAHHHFVPATGGEGGSVLPQARDALRAMESMGVDLVLGGHVHVTHLSTSREVVPGDGPGIPLLACGTTTSSRGRGQETLRNSYNVVRIDAGVIEVVPHVSDAVPCRFLPGEHRAFRRPGIPAAPAHSRRGGP
jgi:3',5'-cyclic AMP phosphodiesterase CpdA